MQGQLTGPIAASCTRAVARGTRKCCSPCHQAATLARKQDPRTQQTHGPGLGLTRQAGRQVVRAFHADARAVWGGARPGDSHCVSYLQGINFLLFHSLISRCEGCGTVAWWRGGVVAWWRGGVVAWWRGCSLWAGRRRVTAVFWSGSCPRFCLWEPPPAPPLRWAVSCAGRARVRPIWPQGWRCLRARPARRCSAQ